MDLSFMREQFNKGVLSAAVVAPAPSVQDAWVLIVHTKDGKEAVMTVARSDRQKVYKSLDAVRADAARVGFTDVRWKLVS